MEQIGAVVGQWQERIKQAKSLPVQEKAVTKKSDCPFTYQNCKDCEEVTYTHGEISIRYLTTECRRSEHRRILLDRSGLFGKDITETFERAKTDKHNRSLYSFLHHKWDRKQWLYIHSLENGTGKSYTANAIANMLIDSGIQPLVKREIDMAAELHDTFGDKSGEAEYAIVGRWKCVDMLIIQDFGKYGCKSEWWPQVMFNVIDYRLIQGKPTIFTSNFNIEDRNVIEKRFGENHGPAIYSRILGMCGQKNGVWEMDGPDRRLITD